MRTAPLSVIAALLCAGCIQGSPDSQPAAEEAIQRHVSTTAPEPAHQLGATFDDQVELLGYDLEPAEPEPGDVLRVTWYWHCRQPLGDGWHQFTHLVNARTGQMSPGGNFDTASVNDLRSLYPPSRWEAGQYIRDVQRIVLPEDLHFEEAEIRTGIYRGNRRLPITSGPRDRENRARGPRFETGFEPPPVAELVLPRAPAPPAIDGRLDDDAWGAAARTAPFVSATTGDRDAPMTKARLMYDDQHLYIGFECADRHIFSTFSHRDDHLWKQDAVEAFIDPLGRGRDYLEFQVSPKGLIFDTKVHRHPRRDDSFDGQAQAAAHLQGTLNDDSNADRSWTAELAVPFGPLGSPAPRPGQSWRLNLFRLDTRLGDRRAFLAWSPPLSNTTHVPTRFGRITFGPLPTSSSGDGGAERTGDARSHQGGDGS